MTLVRVKKSGQIGCLIGIMANPQIKGGSGKKATAVVAVDPKSTNLPPSDARYVIRQLPFKSIEIVDSFPWENNGDTYGSSTSKSVVQKRTNRNVLLTKRWKASKEFAEMKNTVGKDK